MGTAVGFRVGLCVGLCVGRGEGSGVGACEGAGVGFVVGSDVGKKVWPRRGAAAVAIPQYRNRCLFRDITPPCAAPQPPFRDKRWSMGPVWARATPMRKSGYWGVDFSVLRFLPKLGHQPPAIAHRNETRFKQRKSQQHRNEPKKTESYPLSIFVTLYPPPATVRFYDT